MDAGLVQLLNKRIRFFLAVVVVCFIIIGARLFYLQIYLTDLLMLRGQKNFLRWEKIVSPRGNIVDCNGNLLATNRPVAVLYWQGTGKRVLSEEQRAVLETLVLIFPRMVYNEQKLVLCERKNKRLELLYDITFEELSRVVERFPNNPNIVVTTCFKRFYPHYMLASHVVGYLGSLHDEPSGKMGLEKLLEEDLKGTPGEIIKTIDSRGASLQVQEVKQALTGQHLQTTLVLELQRIAEEVFPEDYSGAMLVMDPRTGALQVVVSRPAFNPNIFLESIDSIDWVSLQHNQPFVTRPFVACYPPASLFKLVTMSAALENKLITAQDQWYCCGHLKFSNRNYYCHNQQGHGYLSTKEALAKSCNIPFYEIGKRIKIDVLADYARRFGLGAKTGILFPEREGLIPSAGWKRQIKGEPWWPGETLSVAIGQSFLLVTPLQIICMIAAICEGYLVKPRILLQEAIHQRPLQISSETLDFLKQSMKSVVSFGTGQKLNTLHRGDLEIYAKTGTAQTVSLDKRQEGNYTPEHTWLVAYIQYKNHDPLALTILLEKSGSSRVTTTTVFNFLKQYCTLKDKTEQV
jgi:penicillin-binding protein 2